MRAAEALPALQASVDGLLLPAVVDVVPPVVLLFVVFVMSVPLEQAARDIIHMRTAILGIVLLFIKHTPCFKIEYSI